MTVILYGGVTMSVGKIEDIILESLTGDAQKNALSFITYLSACDMQFEKDGGYWSDKLYWCITYKGESVCYILIFSQASSVDSTDPWVVWTDDSGSKCFADYPLDDITKNIAWKNIDFCGNVNGDCGGCAGRIRKIIFGKEFDNVCGTTFRFSNPNTDAVDCAKKLIEIRKKDIEKSITQNAFSEMDDKLKIKMFSVTLDCSNSQELAYFYASLLNWEKGFNEDGCTWVTGPEKYPFILFQQTDDYEPPVWPQEANKQQQMVHIDFAVNNLEEAIQHAKNCGATLAPEQFSDSWIVMIDPAGHPFCLCPKKTIFDTNIK